MEVCAPQVFLDVNLDCIHTVIFQAKQEVNEMHIPSVLDPEPNINDKFPKMRSPSTNRDHLLRSTKPGVESVDPVWCENSIPIIVSELLSESPIKILDPVSSHC